MNKYVLDTSAMFAYIEDESGADIVEELFVKAMNKKVEIFVSVTSVIELYYITIMEQKTEIARERLELLKALPLEIIDVTLADIETIGYFKAKYKISFADSCIAGLAKSKNAELVHKDPEYNVVPIKQKKLPFNKLSP